MKKLATTFIGGLLLAATLSACSYGAIAMTSTDKVVVMRHDGFLFGALRKAFVCDVTDAGLANCVTSENP